MTTEDVVKALLDKLHETAAQRQRYLTLAEKARTLEEGLRVVIASYGEMPPPPPAIAVGEAVRSVAVAPPVAPQEEASIIGPLAEQIERVLADEGRSLHFKTILMRLQERGVQVPGGNPANNVNAHMSRNKTVFRNVGKGLWALTRWTVEQTQAAPIVPTMTNNDAPPLYEGEWRTATPPPPLPESDPALDPVASPDPESEGPHDPWDDDLDDLPFLGTLPSL